MSNEFSVKATIDLHEMDYDDLTRHTCCETLDIPSLPTYMVASTQRQSLLATK